MIFLRKRRNPHRRLSHHTLGIDPPLASYDIIRCVYLFFEMYEVGNKRQPRRQIGMTKGFERISKATGSTAANGTQTPELLGVVYPRHHFLLSTLGCMVHCMFEQSE